MFYTKQKGKMRLFTSQNYLEVGCSILMRFCLFRSKAGSSLYVENTYMKLYHRYLIIFKGNYYL